MKTFIYKHNSTKINIFEHTETYIKGSFFNEQPKVGDVVMSHQKRENNFLHVYQVEEIISQRDAIIQKRCTWILKTQEWN